MRNGAIENSYEVQRPKLCAFFILAVSGCAVAHRLLRRVKHSHNQCYTNKKENSFPNPGNFTKFFIYK